MTSIFTENKINEIIILNDISKKDDPLSTYKNYLNLKRKRSPYKQKIGINSIEKFQNKNKNNFIISNNEDKAKPIEIKKEQPSNIIKFQNFSNNIFSIIFSYLRIDDLLKLKNIGSHNIRIYINKLFELMKNYNNYYLLNEVICRNNPFINYYDSLNSKKYFLMNGYSKEYNNNVKNNLKIKYILYHKSTNKYYYLIHNLFNNYFCYSEIDTDDENNKITKKILFKLPDKDYYEKFQFLEEYKESEVAFFSINKILLYNIRTNKKDNCIYLKSSCDFVLYKKENKLLISPNSSNEIEFFKIYNSTSIIREAKYILKIGEKNDENPIILNLNDYINNTMDEYDSLICVYSRGDKKIFIFDCKLYKIVNEITSNNNIIRVNIDNNFLIVITEQNINYYSFNSKEYNFINSFNLDKICKIDNINHISFLNSKYLNNLFILITQYNNQNKYKPFLLYLENNTNNEKDFYYALFPLKNDIEDYIYDDELIYTFFKNKKNNNENKMELNMIVCHVNNKSHNLNSSRNYSSDDIKKANIDRKKNNYIIKEYSVNI